MNIFSLKGKRKITTALLSLYMFSMLSPPIEVLGATSTKTVTYSINNSSSSQNTVNIALPKGVRVNSVTTNNGSVTGSSFNSSNQSLQVTVNNGTATSTYNPTKYSKTVSDSSVSSSNSFPDSKSYNSGGYTGNIYKSGSSFVSSGSYTPSQSKTVNSNSSEYPLSSSVPTTVAYSIDGFSGILPRQSINSRITGYQKKTNIETMQISNVCYVYHYSLKVQTSTGVAWVDDGHGSNNYLSSYYEAKSAGWVDITQSGNPITKREDFPPSAGLPIGTRLHTKTLYYTATMERRTQVDDLTKPIYAYYGVYSGTVTKAEIDTRQYTQNYSGTVYSGGYDNNYNYTITVNYEQDVVTLNTSQNTSSWTNGDVILSATADSNFFQNITLPNGVTTTSKSASYVVSSNGSYTFLASSTLGETVSSTVNVTNIDKISPSMSLSQNFTNWSSGNITITATAGDTGGSGVSSIKLPNNNSITGAIATYTVSTNGTYSFEVTDVAGNKTSKSITITNIDTTGASTILTPNTTSWTNQDIVVSVNSTDSQSGVKNIKLPDGTIVTGSTATFTVNSNGTYTVETTDNVGNKSTQSITVSNIDKVVPSLDLSADTLITNLTVTISANAFDQQSGVKAIKLPNGQVVNSSVATYTVPSNGTYIFEAEDVAGNKVSSSITIGNIIVINPVSGINRTEYKLEGATIKDWTTYTAPFNITSEGITTIKARMVDNADNVSNEATSIVKIDRSKPLNGTVEIIIK